MRKVITLAIALLSVFSGSAAIGDRFYDIKETIGNQIVIFDADAIQSAVGSFLYCYDQKGRMKPIKDASQYSTILSNTKVFKVAGITTEKKKDYLEICYGDETYFLLLSPKIDYCDHIRSYSYWEKTFKRYQSDFQYKTDGDYDSSMHPNKQYKAIEWLEFLMPDNMASDVIFRFTEEILDPSYSLSERIISRSLPSDVIEHSASRYITNGRYNLLVKTYLADAEQARQDSIADTRPIIARILNTATSRNEFKNNRLALDFNDNYQISLYSSYSTGFTNFFNGFCVGSEMTFRESDLRFVNPSDADYLKRRLSNGADKRKEVAKANDQEYTGHVLDSLTKAAEKAVADLEKIQKFYQTKKIFITGQEYIFGDYGQFGLRFRFYNPWNKPIKYIVLTLTPYNAVDDVQRDDLGRGKQDVRCIGPIESDSAGTYEFEKIYWDERDIIDRVVVSYVKITFKDNSTVVYSSKTQVDTHRRSHYTLAEMGITD